MLSKYKHSERTWKTNAINIPVTQFELNDKGIVEFNKILKYVKSLNLPTIVRTSSGGISNLNQYNKCNCWDYRRSGVCAEITLLTLNGCWRFQCRTGAPAGANGKPIYGTNALKKFKKICLDFGINIDDYAVENGFELKAQWKEKEKRIYKN